MVSSFNQLIAPLSGRLFLGDNMKKTIKDYDDYITKRRSEGASNETIASELGYCLNTVKVRANQLGLGIKRPNVYQRVKNHIADVNKMLVVDKLPAPRVAEKLGVSEAALLANIKKIGYRFNGSNWEKQNETGKSPAGKKGFDMVLNKKWGSL